MLDLSCFTTKNLNKAYNIYNNLRKINKTQPILDKEILVNYSEFLSLFYYEFGNIKMATKFCDISMQRYKKNKRKNIF
jgi:hypothetical protein